MNDEAILGKLQEQFRREMPLSQAQIGRIIKFSLALLLAGEVHLTKIARFLKGDTQQDSRVRWIERLLKAPFLTVEGVYHPVLKAMLSKFRDDCWHLVIDRTSLGDRFDLATISLNYHKRAIPLVWCRVPFGGAVLSRYVDLVYQCEALIPAEARIVFHGDSEFGGAEMIQALRHLGWDFMLAQAQHVVYRQRLDLKQGPLSTLPVPASGTHSLNNIELFAQHWLGGINLIAFYQPHYTKTGRRKRRIVYISTSLPITAGTRRLGRRRWGTEAFYRDYKSAGWHLTWSRLQNPQRQQGLLIILALTYLLCVCLGRTLSKLGQRPCIDAKPKRHLSLFRLGWDWLIHRLCCGQPLPFRLRLYS
jgi:hypothetical protein